MPKTEKSPARSDYTETPRRRRMKRKSASPAPPQKIAASDAPSIEERKTVVPADDADDIPAASLAPRKKTAASDAPHVKGRKTVGLAVDADDVLALVRGLQADLRSDRPSRGDGMRKGTVGGKELTNAATADAATSDAATATATATTSADAVDLESATYDSRQIVEVSDMMGGAVMESIEAIAVRAAHSVLAGRGLAFSIPIRSAANQLYVAELDRIVLGNKRGTRSMTSVREARKTAITTRVMELIHQVLMRNIHITKRDLFYTDVKLFVDQSDSDGVLDDVACMVGCTRSNLHVVASDKGLVVGRISFVEDGDPIDCTKMGVGGKAIPPYIDKITNIQSDADFILLVEKEAAYMRMAEDRFYNKYPCIVITAKGQPDVATRMFLRRIKSELKIPVLALVDADPYGLKILSVYMSGSKNMSYDSASLTTPDIKWLGLRPSDLDRYDLPEQCRLDMTEHDIKTGKELLNEEFVQSNPAWMRELQIMVKTKKKAEIQALSSFGFQFITEVYLPRKIQEGDWL